MWVCHLCQSTQRQVVCCKRKVCEHSTARFHKIEQFWEHLEVVHPKLYAKLTQAQPR